jgi:enoyl-CoA hydratase/carnithine racemase
MTTEPMVETDRTLVNYRTDGGIAVLEMNDPPANTYTYAMMRQLDEAILRARMDDAVHVIILTGNGDKFFSAGANIQMLSEKWRRSSNTTSACTPTRRSIASSTLRSW